MSLLADKLSEKNNKKNTGETYFQKFISFYIGEELYATEILKIHEITGLQTKNQEKILTKVPSMPRFVKGILDVKGKAVSVIDLREKFGLPPKESGKFTIIMIVDVSGRILGIIVDSVADIVDVNKREIQPPPRFSSTINVEFIRGMLKIKENKIVQGDADEEFIEENKFIIILDMDKLLSDQELDMVDSV